MGGLEGGWLEGLERFAAAREPFVLITVAAVRGHAPRGPGTKMLVARDQVVGTVGGGDLEARAIGRAREMLGAHPRDAAACSELVTVRLTPTGGEHGVQCCGGEVTLLLDAIDPQRGTIAIFGAGHVGKALVGVLAALPVEIVLVDSRADQLRGVALRPAADATLETVHAPIPEAAIETLPPGSHLVILTHDHAEDLAILDTALRRNAFGFLGLIGSETKWGHFATRLREQGHGPEALARVTTPIGLPGVPGKSPGAIAIATAAQLVAILE